MFDTSVLPLHLIHLLSHAGFPPAHQIRACGTTALGSCLGFDRRGAARAGRVGQACDRCRARARQAVRASAALVRRAVPRRARAPAGGRQGPGAPSLRHRCRRRRGRRGPNLVKLARRTAGALATTLLPPKTPLLLTQPGLIVRYQLVDLLRSLVEAARDDAAEPILLLVPGHERGVPKIGDTLVPTYCQGSGRGSRRRGSARSCSPPAGSRRAACWPGSTASARISRRSPTPPGGPRRFAELGCLALNSSGIFRD